MQKFQFAMTLAATLFTMSAVDAAAQINRSEQAALRQAAPAHTVSYKQRTDYTFDEDEVLGSMVRPDGEAITGRTGSKHDSLIRMRDTFTPEMLKSVEMM